MQIEKAYIFAKQIKPSTPPEPPTPQWWFNSPGDFPINTGDWYPIYDTYDWDGYYELASVHEDSSEPGINAVRVNSLEEANNFMVIPLYDLNGQETAYSLRSYVDPTYWDEPYVGFALYNGDTLVDFWSFHQIIWADESFDVYLCAGADTIWVQKAEYPPSPEQLKSGIVWMALIAVTDVTSVSYIGCALDFSMLRDTYGLQLGSDWFTPSN